MTYIWKSPVGTFTIHPDQGMWALAIRDGILGHYQYPEQAADDVFMRATGWSEWDHYDRNFRGPIELSEWERRER